MERHGQAEYEKPASVVLGGLARTVCSRFWSTAGVGDQGSRRGTRLRQSDVQRKTCTKRAFKGEAHVGAEKDLRARNVLRREWFRAEFGPPLLPMRFPIRFLGTHVKLNTETI